MSRSRFEFFCLVEAFALLAPPSGRSGKLHCHPKKIILLLALAFCCVALLILSLFLSPPFPFDSVIRKKPPLQKWSLHQHQRNQITYAAVTSSRKCPSQSGGSKRPPYPKKGTHTALCHSAVPRTLFMFTPQIKGFKSVSIGLSKSVMGLNRNKIGV